MEEYRGNNKFIERSMPHSFEAERALLGSCMLNNSYLYEAMARIEPEDFYLLGHVYVYRALLSIIGAGQETNPILIIEWLRTEGVLERVGGSDFISKLTDGIPSYGDISTYITVVKSKSLRRQIIKASNLTLVDSFEDEGTEDELLDEAARRLFALMDMRTTVKFTPVGSLISDSLSAAQRRQERGGGAITGLSTGYNELDAMTLGLQPTDLIILASRPSMGKTSLSLCIAQNAAFRNNAVVGFFSLEMSEESLGIRIACSEAKVDAMKLRSGYLTRDDWSRLREAEELYRDSKLFIDDTPAISLLHLRAQSRRLAIEQKRLDLIVVDYLQLMSGATKRSESRQQEVSDISRGLKSIAKELKVPLIALSQLSRAPESRTDHRPQMSDLRESGCLTGDSLVAIHTGELIPIRRLAEERLFQGVWSLERRGCLGLRSMTTAFSTGIKPIYELITRTGRRIRATINHKFYGCNGWKQLSDFNVDDEIAVAESVPANLQENLSLRDCELILAGHLIGDGSMLPRYTVHYTTGKRELAVIVEEAAKEVFGESVTTTTVQEGTWLKVGLSSRRKLTRGVRSPAALWAEKLGIYGKRSHEKVIPEGLTRSSNRQISLFLRHLWSTDGHISLQKGRKGNYRVSIFYSTNSPILAEQVQYLLTRLGIRSRHSLVKNRGSYRPTHCIRVLTRIGAVDFISKVGMVETDPRAAVVESIKQWNKVCPSFDSWSLRRQNDILWDKVVSVTPCGEEEVFDLTVPETHSFLANGIIAHNSIEQDADLVAFIYREEQYNRTDENAGRAELIIAKQRNGSTGTIHLAFQKEFTSFTNLWRE